MRPISYNICRIKSDDGHFTSRNVIIHFWDKPYQKINSLKYINATCLVLCYFSSLVFLTFVMELEDAKRPDWNISHGKMSVLVSFSLLWFTLVIKMQNFVFESLWNTSIIFYRKKYDVRLEYVHGKISNFVSFSLPDLTLDLRLRNSDFESH